MTLFGTFCDTFVYLAGAGYWNGSICPSGNVSEIQTDGTIIFS